MNPESEQRPGKQLRMAFADEQAEIDRLVSERRCTRDHAAEFVRKKPVGPKTTPDQFKPLPKRD